MICELRRPCGVAETGGSSASVSEEVGKEEEANEAGPCDISTRVTTRAVRTRKWAGFRELSPCGILFLYSFSLLFSIPKFNFNSNLNSTLVANFILRLKLKLDIITM